MCVCVCVVVYGWAAESIVNAPSVRVLWRVVECIHIYTRQLGVALFLTSHQTGWLTSRRREWLAVINRRLCWFPRSTVENTIEYIYHAASCRKTANEFRHTEKWSVKKDGRIDKLDATLFSSREITRTLHDITRYYIDELQIVRIAVRFQSTIQTDSRANIP